MEKFQHPEYYSEKQLQDIIEKSFLINDLESFGYSKIKIERELSFGSIRPDFSGCCLNESNEKTLLLIEVKKTLNLDGLRQVAFYKKLLSNILLEISIENSTKMMEVATIIYCESLDFDCYDLCAALGFDVFKIKRQKNRLASEQIEFLWGGRKEGLAQVTNFISSELFNV